MAAMLARHWWILVLRGVAAIAFGVLAWFWPNITLIVLVTLFGAYALVDGIFSLITAARGRGGALDWQPRWGPTPSRGVRQALDPEPYRLGLLPASAKPCSRRRPRAEKEFSHA